jgi:hypothetical protein
VPAIYPYREVTQADGLLSYGTNIADVRAPGRRHGGQGTQGRQAGRTAGAPSRPNTAAARAAFTAIVGDRPGSPITGSQRRTLLEDIELMPQDQDFCFQPPSRLEAVAQHADKEEDNYDHQPQSCSDSVVAVTPADGVFGSDTNRTRGRSSFVSVIMTKFCQTSCYIATLNMRLPESRGARA